jgi:endonuclease G, mitochondrial
MPIDGNRFREVAGRVLAKRPDLVLKMRSSSLDFDRLVTQARTTRLAERMEPARSRSIVENIGLRPDDALAESIVELFDRPTVFVTHDDFDLPAEPGIASRLERARTLIKPRLASIGLVEVFDGSVKWPVGTAWMVADGVAVTNRHVAEKFAALDEAGKPVFLTDFRNRNYQVTVDFAEERGSNAEKEIRVEDVIYVARAADGGADLALLKLAPDPRLPRPIPLLASDLEPGAWVAVVGYPQPDERIPQEGREVEENYFGGVYGVKRLSPGEIDAVQGQAPTWVLAHDATTLGGNSGSVLIDLATGSAAGVHFKGVFRKANYAVRATELARVLNRLGLSAVSVAPAPRPGPEIVPAGEEEAVPEDFPGYNAKFISPRDGATFDIPLPKITARAPGTVAQLKSQRGTVLTYRNFSVEMRKDRRLCYYSAVNIDGSATFDIKGARPGWKFDERLDRALQIKDECYGDERRGKFSRGHMTRREDPNWGEDRDQAVISNRHTFFVTNACPQVQPFNAGVWLSLEDYALENCERDDMRIAVFTGPIFRDGGANADPEYFGVKVPVEFWKVIAFKHDETKELTATGYRMSQRNLLPTEEEFVFGQFSQSQVTIRFIEKVTGLDFHHLRDHDPLDDGEEAAGDVIRPLRTPRDIVFKRS